MAMGTRKGRERQSDMWIATSAIVETPGNAFYERLNKILSEHKFDARVEALCRKFYKKSPYGRPSLALGVYFRALLIGYFEGLDSERGIAWRAADSLSGLCPGRSDAGPFDHFPHPAAVLGGDTQSHIPVGGQDSDRRRTDQRPDRFHRCHHARSQRGHEEYRAARGRSDLPRVSEGAGTGGGDREPNQRTVGAAGPETEREGVISTLRYPSWQLPRPNQQRRCCGGR